MRELILPSFFMAIGTDPLPQIEMIEQYLLQGVRLDGTDYIDIAGVKNLLSNIVTHLDFKQRQTVEEGFARISPSDYFRYIRLILDLIDEYVSRYPTLELTASEKEGLINIIESRVLNQFGAPL